MQGTVRKMQTTLREPVEYHLPLGDHLEPMNPHLGRRIRLRYLDAIHCVACGRVTKKSFAQGHCYPCFRSLAACDMCIMKPETCHFAAGTCRQPDWGRHNCFQSHFVYLANSSAVKVGITRGSQIPHRWMDQGATQALPIFRVENRLQSGLLEVALKEWVSDRTDWRKMLKGKAPALDLPAIRDSLLGQGEEAVAAIVEAHGAEAIVPLDEDVVDIHYPVTRYPDKVRSLNFDKQATVEGELLGIKGQYLILDSGVLNIRKFAGYQLAFEVL